RPLAWSPTSSPSCAAWPRRWLPGDRAHRVACGTSREHPVMDRTPRILMCPPDFYGIEYEINPWMNRKVASDSVESHRQWRALHAPLRGLGVAIDLLPPVAALPAILFTANAGLVFQKRFISSRFRHGVRQGETPHFDRWAREHGFTVETLPAGF